MYDLCTMNETLGFSKFGLDTGLIEGVESMGIKTPTPIQEGAIPAIVEGKDVLGIAQTGTGKTAAFLLPVINSIITSQERHVISALIVVPTRELAIQIDQAIQAYGYFTDISSMAIYGGSDGDVFKREKQALTSGADIIVATPGRLVSHLNLGYVDFSKLKFLILDEGDRMLDMGFLPDIRRIIGFTNKERQSLLFSATMPDGIFQMAKQFQRDPMTINIALSKPPSNVKQGAYIVFENQKLPVLLNLFTSLKNQSVIVFSSTKTGVSSVFHSLQKKGLNPVMISSDLNQLDRESALNDFRNKKNLVLVATDVVSRGIDIKGIDVVVNYDVPGDAEDYVHRIGRTGRAEAEGAAYTFVSPGEQIKFKKIEMLIQQDVPKLEVLEQFGPTPEYNPSVSSKPRGNGGGGGGKKRFYKKKGPQRGPKKSG